MNVLAQFIYSAQASQAVTSSEALADPFNKYVTLVRDFVMASVLQGIIDDPWLLKETDEPRSCIHGPPNERLPGSSRYFN